jgi:hypothetical protein
LLKERQLLLEGALRCDWYRSARGAGELLLGGSVETKELRAPLVDACQAIDSVEVTLQDLSPNLVGRHLQPSEADLALLADVFVGCVNGATEHVL